MRYRYLFFIVWIDMETVKRFVRRFRWVIVGLLIIGGLLLLGKGVKKYNAYQGNYTKFSAVDGSFSLEHPRNWSVQIPGKGALVATLMTDSVPTTSTFKPYINIAKGAVKGNLEKEYATAKDKYQKLFRNVKIISEKQVKFGGTPAKMLVMEGSVGGKAMHYTIAFAEHNGEIYTLSAASSPSDAAILDTQFMKVLDSWTFEQKAVKPVPATPGKSPAPAAPSTVAPVPMPDKK
jgi:hypothetical protein